MKWELEWGSPHQLEVLTLLQESGQKVPALERRPTLSRWVLDYFRAFNVLSSSRSSSMGGIDPIPLSEMVSYMDAMHIVTLDDKEYFITMIKALDQVYLEYARMKQKGKGNK